MYITYLVNTFIAIVLKKII